MKPVFSEGSVIFTETGEPVSFERMIGDLAEARIVYVGESHTNEAHHEMQLRILRALYEVRPDIGVGMEMFARPYQKVLNRWINGDICEDIFIQNTHWYATWRYDFSLYREQLHFVRENRIPLKALSLEFHIPARIAAGGIASLLPYQKAHLPDHIDLSDTDYRENAKDAYRQHGTHVKTHYDFENFFSAQVVRDEAMTENLVRHAFERPMIVFAGTGHIAGHHGIPARAHSRTGLPYRTVVPVSGYDSVQPDIADYIWISPSGPRPPHPPDAG